MLLPGWRGNCSSTTATNHNACTNSSSTSQFVGIMGSYPSQNSKNQDFNFSHQNNVVGQLAHT